MNKLCDWVRYYVKGNKTDTFWRVIHVYCPKNTRYMLLTKQNNLIVVIICISIKQRYTERVQCVYLEKRKSGIFCFHLNETAQTFSYCYSKNIMYLEIIFSKSLSCFKQVLSCIWNACQSFAGNCLYPIFVRSFSTALSIAFRIVSR